MITDRQNFGWLLPAKIWSRFCFPFFWLHLKCNRLQPDFGSNWMLSSDTDCHLSVRAAFFFLKREKYKQLYRDLKIIIKFAEVDLVCYWIEILIIRFIFRSWWDVWNRSHRKFPLYALLIDPSVYFCTFVPSLTLTKVLYIRENNCAEFIEDRWVAHTATFCWILIFG